MAINGNILIDKLRITFPIDTLSELNTTEKTYIEKVRETLEQYYPATAYSISSSRGEIKITSTKNNIHEAGEHLLRPRILDTRVDRKQTKDKKQEKKHKK